MSTSNLHGLHHAGVAVWSDSISKAMLDSGDLTRRLSEEAVTGVTSNPTIFSNAIVGSDDYTAKLTELKSSGLSTEKVVKALMADDIQRACDVLADVHSSTDGKDGFVSVEVSPTLADDVKATVAEARAWVKQIDRPNLLVKVPATLAGVKAVRKLIGEGVSVNVTLIFSLERYSEVIDAYLDGLDHYNEMGGDLTKVASVASFFVSRFDTEVDKRLEQIGTPEARALMGKTAVANARAAYGIFTNEFGSTRYGMLAMKGAHPQKPLWASTSTKNPEYDDLLYVEELVAANTINTMPLDTIAAYQDHGTPNPIAFNAVDVAHAKATLHHMETAGVDYNGVVETLEQEGVDKFVASWNELLKGAESV